MLDPHFKAMINAAAEQAANAPPLDAVPPAMIRMGYQMQRKATDQNPPQDVTTKDLQVGGGAGPVPARLYIPAGHDDALAATKWAFDHAAELGMDPKRIAVGGDSAGGNLAASVSIDLKNDPARKIAFQLLLYPGIWPEVETASRKELDGPILTKAALAWFDKSLAAIGHAQSGRAFLGGAKLSGDLPPALVVTAGFDPLKDEGRDYARRLTEAGVSATHVEYPGLIHDFYVMPDVSPAVHEAVKETAAALRAAVG